MWIRSQDGNTLLNLDQVKELGISGEMVIAKNIMGEEIPVSQVRAYIYADDDRTRLGQYSSETYGKYALNYLEHEISSHGFSDNYVCHMPKGKEDE